MCSVLLILLIFVVIFDLVKDSAIQVHVEEAGQAEKGVCKKKLVFTSERSHHIELQSLERCQKHSQCAPLERSRLFTQDCERDGCPRGDLPLEVQLLCKTQQEDTHHVPQVPCTLEHRNTPQHRTKRQRDGLQNRYLGQLGCMGAECARMGRFIMELAGSSFDPKTAHTEPTCKTRKGKREGEQRERWQRERRCRVGRLIALCTTCALNSTLAHDGNLGYISVCDLQCVSNSCVVQPYDTGCDCYGGCLEGGLSGRKGKTGICESSDRESRKRDGQRCCKRIACSDEGPQSSTEGPAREQRSQAAPQSSMGQACWRSHPNLEISTPRISQAAIFISRFQDVSIKAKNDIDVARNTIQELNAKAASTGIAGQPIPSAVEEDTNADGDKEEEKLKKDMQAVLQSCATSLGLELSSLKEVQEVPSEEEEGEPSNKRPRSMEPFGGSAMKS